MTIQREKIADPVFFMAEFLKKRGEEIEVKLARLSSDVTDVTMSLFRLLKQKRLARSFWTL